ncbi:MAG: rhodanese-like domain-containing protein [Thermodesulfobacteriota bacterium]
MKKLAQILLCALTALFLASPLVAEDFPGRAQYPKTTPISTADLFREHQAGTVVIVDVRSGIEFDVIRPKGARHIPISDMLFVKRVQELAAQNQGKKIAFYCNGVTCLKSYEAAEKALEGGIKNVYVYDAGVPDWVKVYPGETLLLGKVVVDPKKQIISGEEFKKKTVPFDEFKALAAGEGVVVVDVRDHVQRTGELPGLGKILVIPLDKFIPNFVEKKMNQDKKLLIFDQVGKQVQWLEYYLVEHGYKNYVFLAGGATAVLKKQEYK